VVAQWVPVVAQRALVVTVFQQPLVVAQQALVAVAQWSLVWMTVVQHQQQQATSLEELQYPQTGVVCQTDALTAGRPSSNFPPLPPPPSSSVPMSLVLS
jgi:hypothetical protein